MANSCSNCSSLVSDGDAFCGFCGQSANGNSPSSRVMSSPVTLAPEPVMAAVADMPGDAWPASSSSRPSSALPRAGPAVGQAGPNAMYMGMRLQYQPTPEPGFDPLGSVRFIRQMIQRWVLYFVVY